MNTFVSYNLPVLITKQNKRFVAYTPALDISTSGKTKKDAQKKFQELVSLFLEEIFEAGTAKNVLSELGWTRHEKRWSPPEVVFSTSMGIRVPAMA